MSRGDQQETLSLISLADAFCFTPSISRQMRLTIFVSTLTAIAITSAPVIHADEESVSYSQVTVDPVNVELVGPNARFRLLVYGNAKGTRVVDLTRSATFRTQSPAVVEISRDGNLRAVADGHGSVEVVVGKHKVQVKVKVSESTIPRTLNFENDIIPIFSRYGCNASGCHGKAEGQNGFKLSVFGFNPEADRVALKDEGRGRRVFPTVPDRSLLLQKAAGGLPHGGGIRIRRNAAEYKTLRSWIAAGMPFGDESDPRVVSIDVAPNERRMSTNSQQQLRVVATYSDGRKVDVTDHARFQSNNETLARVDEFGIVRAGENPGEVAVMASYMGAVDVFRSLIPQKRARTDIPSPTVLNFIDELVDAKLSKLNIVPSGLCDDADFLRRVHLDIIGTLPTAIEARAFLNDKKPGRRRKLVDDLLKRPEYADFWALKWADLLRVDRLKLGHKGAYNYYRWIRDSFASNRSYNQFAREIVTATGSLNDAPSGYLYKAVGDPGKVASTVSQVLLGVRLECAQCHHHPYDRWSQSDYYGMQSFFTQVKFKGSPRGAILTTLTNPTTKHPRYGTNVFAHALMEPQPTANPPGDRRKVLADWMTDAKNPLFAQNLVNRMWAHFLGRGIIEPVDDVRLTNPPTNPELLSGLSKRFVESGFNIHELIRTITSSRTYQLSSTPNATNERDEQNYSRALFKRVDAEVLFDAICQTTGVSEKFRGMPTGYRAIQLWDSQVPHYFLRLFGRPIRATPCECERTAETNVSQVLHILNSPKIHDKLSHDGGRIAKLVRTVPDDGRLIEELYLTFYSRFPSADELATAASYFNENANRRQAAEDIAWSMMNTVEFLFNH